MGTVEITNWKKNPITIEEQTTDYKAKNTAKSDKKIEDREKKREKYENYQV